MSDLIVKGAGEIKDGLYNIKDGKLFKYKANGGTVRTYPIVSADRWRLMRGVINDSVTTRGLLRKNERDSRQKY